MRASRLGSGHQAFIQMHIRLGTRVVNVGDERAARAHCAAYYCAAPVLPQALGPPSPSPLFAWPGADERAAGRRFGDLWFGPVCLYDIYIYIFFCHPTRCSASIDRQFTSRSKAAEVLAVRLVKVSPRPGLFLGLICALRHLWVGVGCLLCSGGLAWAPGRCKPSSAAQYAGCDAVNIYFYIFLSHFI